MWQGINTAYGNYPAACNILNDTLTICESIFQTTQ